MQKYENYTPQIIEMLEQGKSIEKIALHFNKSKRTIEDRLRDAGYRKPKGEWIKPAEEKEEEEKGQWLVGLRSLKDDREIEYYKLELVKEII